MASVRRRKTIPKYQDGGRVPVAEPVDIIPEDDGSAVLLRAVEATMRADRMAKQRAEPTVEQMIDATPGLSDQKREFLKRNPDLTISEKWKVTVQRHAEAIRSGIEDDSPEMFDYLLTGVQRADNGKFVAEPEPEPAPAPARPAPIAPAPAIRKSMPMTAPISRSVPSYGGKSESGTSTTLSPEEQRIALSSYSAPGMSADEKVRAYALNKMRLQRMRAAGVYPERERG